MGHRRGTRPPEKEGENDHDPPPLLHAIRRRHASAAEHGLHPGRAARRPEPEIRLVFKKGTSRRQGLAALHCLAAQILLEMPDREEWTAAPGSWTGDCQHPGGVLLRMAGDTAAEQMRALRFLMNVAGEILKAA